jgi:aspartate/methionine/tyrosine aminotransferase
MLATIALRSRKALLERNVALIRKNIATAQQFFDVRHDLFEFAAPNGGCVCFVKYKGADGVENFTKQLVEEAGVLLLPSGLYRSDLGSVPQEYFRLGLGRALVPDALKAMQNFLRRSGP